MTKHKNPSPNKSTTSKFIAKAKAKWGDKFDYDKVVYKGAHDKIIITCKLHGDYRQSANNHLIGRNCPKCGKISRKATRIIFMKKKNNNNED